MRPGRLAVVFEPGEPPRTGAVSFYDPAGAGLSAEFDRLGEHGELPLALPGSGRVVARPVPVRTVPVGDAVRQLVALRDAEELTPAAAFWSAVAVTGLHLAARGRLLPGVSPDGYDAWRVGPFDVADVERVRALAAAMPTEARAVPLDPTAERPRLPDPEGLVRAFLDAVADTLPRTPAAPWLTGDPRFTSENPVPSDDLRDWAREVSAGVDTGLRVALRLELREHRDTAALTAVVRMRSLADPTLVSDAAALWEGDEHGLGERATFEAMLAVRRAAAVWPPLGRLLDDAAPVSLDLFDEDLVDLLGGAEARLAAAGIDLQWPPQLSRDLHARVLVSTPPEPPAEVATHLRGAPPMPLSWQLTLAGAPLTEAEMDLAAKSGPIVRLRDRWVAVGPELARKARDRQLPPLAAYDALGATLIGSTLVEDERAEVVADGWLGALRERIAEPAGGPEPLEPPAGLRGTLREYQLRGLRWLQRMTSLGFGGCLADDMGLGKTVTVIALHLRRQADPATVGPTLVVCPASVLGNWEREIHRFAPGVPVHRFHGAARSLDPAAGGFVLTSYGTARLDAHVLAGPRWGLVVADEAQYVKNRLSDTAKALRRIPARARLALTGTPVENNLAELWAILDWSTPGLLGDSAAFRARWARPIEVDRDAATVDRLFRLVRPFLLRRRKADPGVAPELPPKTVTDHLVSLTGEQATLYRAVVADVMAEIRASSTAIARRGLVLKLLVGLKQVCNHPAHYLKQPHGALTGRSEKLQLVDDLLETILAEDGGALVFTQYVQMGRLLHRHLTARGVPAQLLHGGTPVPQREEMVRRFQAGEVPVFLLSLKAAGTGLNLTRADHVIHYDRWWNPAVEEQATDRAYRIGQTKPVQVHRLIAQGTLEERIAALLEAKQGLADAVLSGGESPLTELSDAELLRLVQLRDER
ncbi:Helicase conserved C-terminal domain-containing protein [Micromonospora echinaurantiaca]|uniref:Helicase conserved C-terminal domain-containing protein n=1 Tax=Micromonospora echinaurantiaca TaxID=47857 RepID=A0A1C5HEX6_9ACTN|nr:DEAD/DEAH box helicase [Micromonospora echinaurantiaca]SCG44578.1 Helicase conserved C-terminal domain-containing protein [Micromonospora echinaurantiaca]